jgi:serine phosphatase RsbU (regulator of sigma subunit)
VDRRRPSLTGRLRALVVGVSVVLIAVVLAIGASMADFRDDVSRRDRLIPATTDASQLTGLFVDALQETGPTGAIALSPEAYRDARQGGLVLLGRLEGELARQPELTDLLDELRGDLLAWEPADLARLQDLAAHSETLATSISGVAERAVGTAATSRDRFMAIVVAAAAIALVLLGVGATALRRLVVLPIRRLSTDVEGLFDGAPDAVLEAESSRELALLADAVNRMRDRALAERDRALRAAEALAHQAPAVAALRTLLEPRRAQPPPGLTIAGALVPAHGELAGDWYDVDATDTAALVALGDICGHGVEAGVLAVRTKFALLDAMALRLDPAAALGLAAQRFARDDTFATAIYAEIDVARGICRYASAGHNPALVLRADGSLEHLPRTGPLIGLVDAPRPATEVALGAGDLLVLYTDGVVEARDHQSAQIEVEGLEAVVREHAAADPERIVEAITGAVLAHCGGRCSDDATVVVVRVDATGPS